MITFKFTNAPYGYFSNFSKHKIIGPDGLTYLTSEHLYQSMKFQDEDKREIIRNAKTAHDAAVLGRTLGGIVPNWDDIKIDVMRKVLILKLEQYPFIKMKLLETGDEEIIEISSKDRFWGKVSPTGPGENHLGRLWMELREQYRKTNV